MEMVNNLKIASRSQLDLMKGGSITAYLPAASPFFKAGITWCVFFRDLRLPQKDEGFFLNKTYLFSFGFGGVQTHTGSPW